MINDTHPCITVVGDRVWPLTRNIRTQRPSKKLDHRKIGPYPVEAVIGSQAYAISSNGKATDLKTTPGNLVPMSLTLLLSSQTSMPDSQQASLGSVDIVLWEKEIM